MKATQTKIVAIEGTRISISVAGCDRPPIALDAMDLSDDIQRAAMMHGLSQKIGDGAAISRNPETGRAATPLDKWQAMNDIAKALIEGTWNRAGGGASGGILLQALIRLYPAKTAEQLRDWLAGQDEKAKRALKASPKVAKMIADIQAESGANAERADELLAELDDD